MCSIVPIEKATGNALTHWLLRLKDEQRPVLSCHVKKSREAGRESVQDGRVEGPKYTSSHEAPQNHITLQNDHC